MKIREDLEGVVIVTSGLGKTLTLAAGDVVPDGVKLGEHLTSETGDEAETSDVESETGDEAETSDVESETGDEAEPVETPAEAPKKPATRKTGPYQRK